MWFAVTANPVSLKKGQKKKEFFSGEIAVILNAGSKELLEKKLIETAKKFPEEMKKYKEAGIKFVEAGNIIQAKRIAKDNPIYYDKNDQYNIL